MDFGAGEEEAAYLSDVRDELAARGIPEDSPELEAILANEQQGYEELRDTDQAVMQPVESLPEGETRDTAAEESYLSDLREELAARGIPEDSPELEAILANEQRRYEELHDTDHAVMEPVESLPEGEPRDTSAEGAYLSDLREELAARGIPEDSPELEAILANEQRGYEEISETDQGRPEDLPADGDFGDSTAGTALDAVWDVPADLDLDAGEPLDAADQTDWIDDLFDAAADETDLPQPDGLPDRSDQSSWEEDGGEISDLLDDADIPEGLADLDRPETGDGDRIGTLEPTDSGVDLRDGISGADAMIDTGDTTATDAAEDLPDAADGIAEPPADQDMGLEEVGDTVQGEAPADSMDLPADAAPEQTDVPEAADVRPPRVYDDFEQSVRDVQPDFYDSGAFYQQGVNEYGYSGTCGPTSQANALNKLLDTNEFTENKILKVALDNSLCEVGSSPELSGGTDVQQFMDLYDKVNDQIGGKIHTELYEFNNALDVEAAAAKLEEGCVLNVAVDAEALWGQPRQYVNAMGIPCDDFYSDHWITVTGVRRDGQGAVAGFDIIDSGGGASYVDAEKYHEICFGTEDHRVLDPTTIVVSKNEAAEGPALSPEAPDGSTEAGSWFHRIFGGGKSR